ncbi:hypothetical protein EV426DRAFT_535702 [Tirmania nivea]|nr:hypothetical protein EV426DRAFT_535702 [Tirmania nivea]
MVRDNIWIAAADGDESAVLDFLSRDPSAVNSLDGNGYTVLHATTSYNHIALLKKLVLEHGGDANIQDHDGDTPLFVAETVEVARTLVEELHADPNHRNELGLTATEVMEEDGEFPLVAAYLRGVQNDDQQPFESSINNAATSSHPVSFGPDVSVRMSTAEEGGVDLPPVDEEFRQRIEELASRGSFNSEEGQTELRKLVTEAVNHHVLEPDTRNVKPRQDEP